MADKAHCVEVTITSKTNGVVNQTVTFTEYAATEKQLVTKNFALAESVIAAVRECCNKFAAPYLK